MVLKKVEHQVQVMLADTILALCRNTLPYKTEVSIEGLLAITLDKENILVVNINEILKNRERKFNNRNHGTSDSSTEENTASCNRVKKKTKKFKKKTKKMSVHERNDKHESEDYDSNIEIRNSDSDIETQNETVTRDAESSDPYIQNSALFGGHTSETVVDVKPEQGDSDVMMLKVEPIEEEDIADTRLFVNIHNSEMVGDTNMFAQSLSTDMQRSSISQSSLVLNPEFIVDQSPSTSTLNPDMNQYGLPVSLQGDAKKSDGGPVTCQVCQEMFDNPPSLAAHMNETQHKEKAYVCELCCQQFSMKGNLNAHYRSVHTRVKPHICHLCAMAFARNSTLKRHMQVHFGIKKYSCNLCDKSYSEKYRLYLHMRSVHDKAPG